MCLSVSAAITPFCTDVVPFLTKNMLSCEISLEEGSLSKLKNFFGLFYAKKQDTSLSYKLFWSDDKKRLMLMVDSLGR